MVRKVKRHCRHYNVNGHIRDICFNLHVYPEWYEDFKNKKAKTCIDVDNDTGKASMDDNYIKFAHIGDFAGTILNFALNSIEFLPTGM